MPLEFRPNLEKIVELLVYLAYKMPGVDKYQAVKFFYLADKEHLNRHGRPITSDAYFALPYGPVASKAKELIEQDKWTMREAGLKELPFKTERKGRQGPDKNDLIIICGALRDVDFDVFSNSDLRVFDEILNKYGKYDFDDLYNITHEHEAYKKAWAKRGPYKRSKMSYDDMIESNEQRAKIVSDIGPFSARI
ncbi:DUF4065 domain-containing protein [bacterium M00.F.Ca.ET.230.01.1.1]|nr:DUF4065 domain-containing protein [bacterium M00.F.Ca.ET.230.01.1.1]